MLTQSDIINTSVGSESVKVLSDEAAVKILDVLENKGALGYQKSDGQINILKSYQITIDKPIDQNKVFTYKGGYDEVNSNINSNTSDDVQLGQSYFDLSIAPQTINGKLNYVVDIVDRSTDNLFVLEKNSPTKFLSGDGTYKEIPVGGEMDYVTINRRFSGTEFRYYGQVGAADYDKLYDAIVNNKALAVVWTENNAIYAMTMLGKKSTYVENTSIHIECIAVQYTTGNAGGNNGYGFEPLYLTLERSNILPSSIIEGEMESEGQFMFLNSGDGNKYLADNGEYKEIASVRELYISAGAVYNEQTGFYELNGLTDITESQMRYIYTCCGGNPNSYDLNQKYEGFKIRTNIPFRCDIGNVNEGVDASRLCYLNSSLEVFKISTNNLAGYMTVLDGSDMFAACSKLTKIIGRFIFRPSTDAKNMFNGCRSLQELYIQNLYTDLFLGHSPLLSLQSFEYIIEYAKNTTPITIKVHADVYAKLQDESQTDWHALIETAAAKQITFATA